MTDTIIATGYRSYLVRFWQSTEQGDWRASAQCVQSGNTVLFGTLESLFAFLQTEIGVIAREASARAPTHPARSASRVRR